MTLSVKKTLGAILTIALLGGIIALRTIVGYSSFNPARTNFTTFWLPGRMLLENKNPYNEIQYLGEHDQYDVQWRPNKIFPYPLPLAVLLMPLGLFTISQAYVLWLIISQIIVVATLYTLLRHWDTKKHRVILVPIFAFLFVFGPLYFTLLAGSIGALALLFLLCTILLLEDKKSLLAGIVLALTMLKPPQGLTILLLAGVWFLARKDWKAIIGVGIGGIALFLVGMFQDPLWVGKFLNASQAVMDRTQGVHSNVWAFAYIGCKGASPCSQIFGGAGSLILLGWGAFFLWKNQARLTTWEAFNVIIPIGFVSTLYLWAYDQILYIIPVTWIVGMLVEKRKGYLTAFLFLLVLVIYSFFALAIQANTLKDLWSLGNTVIVLSATLWIWYSQADSQKNLRSI